MPRALRTPALQAPPRDPRHPPVPAAPTSGVGRWRARCPGGTGGWDVKWSSERVQVIFWRWKNWKSWEFFSMGAATLLLLLLLLIIIIIIIILLLRVHSLIQPSCGPFKPSMAATAPRNGSIWPTSPLCASAGWESFVLFRLEIRKAALWHPKITKSWLGFNGNTCGFRMKMFDFFNTYLYVFLYFHCHYHFVRHPPVFLLNPPLHSDPSTDCILPYWLTATWGYYLKERLLSLHKPPSVSNTFGPFILTKEKNDASWISRVCAPGKSKVHGFCRSIILLFNHFVVDLYNPLRNPPRISDPSSGEFYSSRVLIQPWKKSAHTGSCMSACLSAIS